MHLTELTADPASRSTPDERTPTDTASSAPLRLGYVPAVSDAVPGVLAAIRFGNSIVPTSTQASAHALDINVRLESLTPAADAAYMECWQACGPVTVGKAGSIRYASDSGRLFAVSEIDERECGGVQAAAAAAYAEMRRFQQDSGFPHLLRIWNYLDGINCGAEDQERYRQFCLGRARGLGDMAATAYPAASALGHQATTHRLQVYWLASRTPGTHVENPRQVSAYRYPRTYGPASPSFARATLTRDGALLVSGTASIVGHLSRHPGDPGAQLDETLRNLATLGADGTTHPASEYLLKVYVRDPANFAAIAEGVRAAFPHSPAVFLAADICRKELLLEIELVRLGLEVDG